MSPLQLPAASAMNVAVANTVAFGSPGAAPCCVPTTVTVAPGAALPLACTRPLPEIPPAGPITDGAAGAAGSVTSTVNTADGPLVTPPASCVACSACRLRV